MKHLEKAIHSISTSKTEQKKTERLCQAFEMFSKETVKLEASYNSLQKHFQQIGLELKETNEKLESNLAELNTTTGYLKSILDHIAQGILFIDFNGKVTTYNHSAELILQIPMHKILLNNFWENFDDHVFGFSMRRALEEKCPLTIDCISYITPGNIHSELEVIITFILHHSSDLSEAKVLIPVNHSTSIPTEGMIVMLRDVTEMRHLQTLASRNDRMKVLGEMAAQVAHEIRNPLGGIKGFASLLKRDLVGSPELEQMAAYIIEGTDNLNRLVGQILHYARPVQLSLEAVDVIAILNELKQHMLADSSINQQQITISINSKFQEIHMLLDPFSFKSALLNLIVNAIQAMPNGGDLSLSVNKTDRHLFIEVLDTGSGITEDSLAKLYSPFFTTKPDGNGLGLSEAQKVIQAHGGTLDVTSVVDKGSSFTIKLPLNKGYHHD